MVTTSYNILSILDVHDFHSKLIRVWHFLSEIIIRYDDLCIFFILKSLYPMVIWVEWFFLAQNIIIFK